MSIVPMNSIIPHEVKTSGKYHPLVYEFSFVILIEEALLFAPTSTVWLLDMRMELGVVRAASCKFFINS